MQLKLHYLRQLLMRSLCYKASCKTSLHTFKQPQNGNQVSPCYYPAIIYLFQLIIFTYLWQRIVKRDPRFHGCLLCHHTVATYDQLCILCVFHQVTGLMLRLFYVFGNNSTIISPNQRIYFKPTIYLEPGIYKTNVIFHHCPQHQFCH